MDVDYMAGVDDMAFFESEDDKWMMGDFDIDLDVDMGRPIDFEADESVTNQDDSGFQDANSNSSGNVDPRKATPSVSGPGASASAQRDGAAPVSGHSNAGNGGLGFSTNGGSNPARGSGGSNPANTTSTGAAKPNGNGGKEVSFQLPPNPRLNGNGNNRGQQFNGPIGTGTGNNGNLGGRMGQSSSTSTVQHSSSTNSRPSAGGFSFPPGVVRVFFYATLERDANETDRSQEPIWNWF